VNRERRRETRRQSEERERRRVERDVCCFMQASAERDKER
jgi:hypothetical protein